MSLNNDPNRVIESIESFLRIKFDNLVEQGKSSTKQTILFQLISYAFSALAIIFSIIIATNTNKIWIIVLILIISIGLLAIYYVLFQKYNSATAKHTDSHHTNTEIIRDFSVLTVDYIEHCHNLINHFNDSDLDQDSKVALFFFVYEKCDTALVVLERIFKAGYAKNIIGMKPNSQLNISLYRLEYSIKNLRSTILFLVEVFYNFPDSDLTISSEAKNDIFFVLIPNKQNTRTLISRYNSLLDDMSTFPKTSYIPNKPHCQHIQKSVYQKSK